MPTQETIADYTAIAGRILAMCKQIQPDFYSAETNPGMAEAWGNVFASKPYPPGAYIAAVTDFYAQNVDGKRPGVGDIIAAVKRVVSAWESDPARSVELQAHRAMLQDQRDREIAAGTFGANRGYVPRAVKQQEIERRVRQQHASKSASDKLAELLGDARRSESRRIGRAG